MVAWFSFLFSSRYIKGSNSTHSAKPWISKKIYILKLLLSTVCAQANYAMVRQVCFNKKLC